MEKNPMYRRVSPQSESEGERWPNQRMQPTPSAGLTIVTLWVQGTA